MVRDRDAVYGDIFIRRLRAMGIRDRPTAARSPWQNAYAERLIGSIRRECLDNVAVFGERHLRHLLGSYQKYYNDARTHLSLDKDAPVSRAFRNSSVQGAYLIIAARALGLDCGPMEGFDNGAVDEAFFAGTNIKTNFICSLGVGSNESLSRAIQG
jgi:nitroreductase